MASAFAASMRGVSLFEGSLIRSRAKFCDSAMTRPCSMAACEVRAEAGVETAERNGLDLALLLFGAVFVRFEIGDDQPFDHGLRGSGAALAFAREKSEFLTPRDFRWRNAVPAILRRSETANFSGLPAPTRSSRFAASPFGKWSSDEFERLAGHFAARCERGEAAIHGAVDFAEDSVEFVFLIEDVGDERVGLYRKSTAGSRVGSACLPFDFSSPAGAGDRFVGFAFGFLASFGFAAVVEFLASGDRQFAFCDAVAEVNLRAGRSSCPSAGSGRSSARFRGG